MPNLHVLILPSWYSTSKVPSSGIFFQRQALALSKAGVQVGIIYPDIAPPGSGGEYEGSKVEITFYEGRIPEVRLRRQVLRPLRPWARHWATQKLFLEYQKHFGVPDLVHAHAALWAGVIASFLPVPYVLTEHWTGYAQGLVRPWQVPLIKRAFWKARARLAVSTALAEDLRRYVGPLEVQVLPNVVDTDFFVPPSTRPSYPPLRLVSVALLNRVKRLDTVIRALGFLVKWGMDVVLDLGGDGPEKQTLEKLAYELGVGERVRFLGHLSPEDVRRALHSAHMFVLTSEYETFGVVYAEALSCGLPVVATERGGPRDFVVPEVGRLVPPGDVVALANAIANIWNNYDHYRPSSLHAYVERLFSERTIARRLIDIYEQVKGVSRRA